MSSITSCGSGIRHPINRILQLNYRAPSIFTARSVFTARRNARFASAVLARAIPSVCLYVRLSHAGIVSKDGM